jgi:N-acetylneuraminic acid mutarotase
VSTNLYKNPLIESNIFSINSVECMNKKVATLLGLFLLVSLFAVLVSPVVAYDEAEDSWVSVSSMPTARGDFGVEVVNDKIYAIGGAVVHQDVTSKYREEVGVNEEYDPVTNSWVSKTPMPIPSSDFATAVYKNKIYCTGAITQVYDPATDTSIPTPEIRSQANVVNGKIYIVAGGLNQAYDPLTDIWSVKASTPEGFRGVACVFEEKIYVMGSSGFSDDPNYPSTRLTPMTQIYDPNMDSWSVGTAPKFTGRAYTAVTAGIMAPAKIYVFYNPSNAPNFVTYLNQVYDPKTDSWVAGARMPDRRGFGVAVVNDMIYVLGGYTLTYPSMIDPDQTIYYNYKAAVERYVPFGYGTVPPKISVASPQNTSYHVSDVSLDFVVNRPVDWLGYSLDGTDNVTVAGNFSLTGLSDGAHNITVYARDSNGNVGVSETVTFTVSKSSFPIEVVAGVSGALVAIVGVGLFCYFKKRKN